MAYRGRLEDSPQNSEGQVIAGASRDLTQNQGRSHGCRRQFHQPTARAILIDDERS